MPPPPHSWPFRLGSPESPDVRKSPEGVAGFARLVCVHTPRTKHAPAVVSSRLSVLQTGAKPMPVGRMCSEGWCGKHLQQVRGMAGGSPPLRHKLTGAAPRWRGEPNVSGPQVGVTFVAPATNVATLRTPEIHVADAIVRLIKNSIICWNYLYLTQKIAEEHSEAQRQTLLAAVRNGSVVTWQHINLHGEYDFSDEKLQDSVGLQAAQTLALNLHRTGKAEMAVPLSH